MAKEQLWGYIDRKGQFVVEPRFHDAWNFHEGLAVVKVEWARGYIDREGSFVVEPKYQYAGPFRDGKACVMLDDKWEYIDREGNPIGEAEPVRMEEDSVPEEMPLPALKGNKYGYADAEGEFVIKPAFVQAKPFSEGLAAVLVKV